MFRQLLSLAMVIGMTIPCISNAASNNWHQRGLNDELVTPADIAAEIVFGRAIAARILGKHIAYANPALVRYISLVGNTLAQSSNRPELEFHFLILDTDELNSYAAPGGYIFISTGTIKLLKDESELAGVLAHEIAHITERQVVKKLDVKGANDTSTLALFLGGKTAAARNAFVYAADGAASTAGGSNSAARATFGKKIEQGFQLIYQDKYEREDELQAVTTSVFISVLSGYDPLGLARYLNRIKPIKENSATMPGNTTLSIDNRVAQINDVIAIECVDDCVLATNINRFDEEMKSLRPSPF